jgi:pimeloyl-ACP methyl ester carboxylesterase
MRLIRRVTAFRLQSPHTPRAEMHRFLRLTASTTRRGYLNRLAMLMQYDVRQRLRELRAPALFLAADRDHLIPSVAQARYMSERVPAGEMRILTGHGHACLVAPDVNLDTILDEWTAWRDRPTGATSHAP